MRSYVISVGHVPAQTATLRASREAIADGPSVKAPRESP
jgi:hypothetical protein